MELTFKEDTHEYFVGDKKLISVTQLMQKHGLAPNYGDVPNEVLKAKAERGTLVHAEIEAYIKRGEVGFTTELTNFIYYFKKNNEIRVEESEKKEHNDVVAGTIDLILDLYGQNIIADIKTTATLHKEAVSWQLSIYAYLYDKEHYNEYKGQAFHFGKYAELNVVDIPLKPFEEVEKLMECERNGTLYKQELTTVETELSKLYEVESLIASIENQKKEAEAKAVKLRTALMDAMQKQTIKKFENERIIITYVDPVTRTTIDSAKLKIEKPDVYAKYSKTNTSKASLRITLKEVK